MEFFFPSILPAVLSSLVSHQAEMISAEIPRSRFLLGGILKVSLPNQLHVMGQLF